MQFCISNFCLRLICTDTRRLAQVASVIIILSSIACSQVACVAVAMAPSSEVASMSSMLSAAMASIGAGIGDSVSGDDAISEDSKLVANLFEALAQTQIKKGKSNNPQNPPNFGKQLMTAAKKQSLLDLHNSLRSKIALGQAHKLQPAANMALLEWDDCLAETAAHWAAQCIFDKKDSPSNRAIADWPGTVGQITVAEYLDDINLMMTSLWEQSRFWDPPTDQCKQSNSVGSHGDSCAGIRQLASSSARLVGCDLRDCSGISGGGGNQRQYAVLLVCNYAELGGKAGRSSRGGYLVGPACTACPGDLMHCLRGLCTNKEVCKASKTQCEVAACLDNPTCSSKTMTKDCASSNLRKLCPKLCGVCGAVSAAESKLNKAYQPLNKDNIVSRVVDKP